MALSNSTMRRVSLRNIASHKLRLALTIIAVVLGTAFISGAFMFTKALSDSFDSAVSTSFDGVDVVAQPAADAPGVTPEQLEALRADDQVGNVNVFSNATVVVGDEEGNSLQEAGTSRVDVWYPGAEAVGAERPLVDGEAPHGPKEAVLPVGAAEKHDISVGDRLIVVDQNARHEVTVTGTFDTDDEQSRDLLNLGMDEAGFLEAFTTTGMPGQVTASAAGADRDDSDDEAAQARADELREHLEQAFPDLQFDTGKALAEQVSETVSQALKFVNYFLVAFGLIGLLVGTFLIANTFSMIVAQRNKEFALLRALGASRRQITVSVVFEALVVGLVGSVVGVLGGMGLVAAIKAVLSATGNTLPSSGLGLSVSAVVVPLVLGTAVTVVSAWAPAQRAGRVQPVEAMRSSESSTATPLVGRTVVGLLLALVGAAAAGWGALSEDAGTASRAVAVGAGLVFVIVGFFFAGPALSIPVVPGLGRLIGLPFGAVGKLAATNSRRNPRRVATTAFALTLGISLVTAIGMLGQTMKASLADMYEEQIRSDFVLSGPTGGQIPLPAETAQIAREVDGVERTGEIYLSPVRVQGAPGIPGAPYGELVDGDVGAALPIDPAEPSAADGGLEALDLTGKEGLIAEADTAAAYEWVVGEYYPVAGPTGEPVLAPLLATFTGSGHMVLPVMVTKTTGEKIAPPDQTRLYSVNVIAEEGADLDKLRADLENAVKPLLVVQVMDNDDMAGEGAKAIDSMLNILYGMLALAVVIAVLGIVNTLTLNVIERRQEIGMLRAVGTQRGQVRTMIILEAVAIAVFGAVSGIVIGLGLGWAFLRVLAGEGLETISVPWSLIGWMLLGSAVVGVLSAVWPAVRASRTAPLDAIAED